MDDGEQQREGGRSSDPETMRARAGVTWPYSQLVFGGQWPDGTHAGYVTVQMIDSHMIGVMLEYDEGYFKFAIVDGDAVIGAK